jgi:hypothetical protein
MGRRELREKGRMIGVKNNRKRIEENKENPTMYKDTSPSMIRRSIS